MMTKRLPFSVLAALVSGALFACDAREEDVDTASEDVGAAADTGVAPTGEIPSARAALTTAESGELGPYIADSEGRALYLFEPDSAGQSTCYDACAEAWPPVVAPGGDLTAASESVREELIGTIERKDGTRQVTYGGHPLYYFVKDQGPGTAMGQDVKGFGGEWYLVTPTGEKLEQHAGR